MIQTQLKLFYILSSKVRRQTLKSQMRRLIMSHLNWNYSFCKLIYCCVGTSRVKNVCLTIFVGNHWMSLGKGTLMCSHSMHILGKISKSSVFLAHMSLGELLVYPWSGVRRRRPSSVHNAHKHLLLTNR